MKILKEEDICHIKSLCERSKDYFFMDQGVEPNELTAIEILESLPPKIQKEDKHVIGYFDKEKGLVALVDLIKNYPTLKEWTLGLLLLDPSFRKKGIGAQIHKKIVSWISAQNGTSIRIGVLENNKAVNFWEKIGYHSISNSVLKRENKEERMILIMEYSIDS